MKYEWPGNVRQLKNVVERLVIMTDEPVLDVLYLSEQLDVNRYGTTDRVPETVEKLKARKQQLVEDVFGRIQRAFLIKALKASSGNVTRAAERVGMAQPNFCALLRKQNIAAHDLKKHPRECEE